MLPHKVKQALKIGGGAHQFFSKSSRDKYRGLIEMGAGLKDIYKG